jgi:hypothetical protein
VAQTCPIDIARDIERRWQRRSSAGIALVPRNEAELVARMLLRELVREAQKQK